MARGGFRPGAGRPRKSGGEAGAKAKTDAPKRAKRAIAEPIGAAAQRVLEAAAGQPEKAKGRKFESALDFAMAVLNGEIEDAEMADKVRLAVAAMPFQHAKLAEKAESKGDAKAASAKSAASGKYAPPPPPGSRVKPTVYNA